MTGNEFLDQLKQRADFLKPNELESLINYYENRILKAKSADEEEKIVADFGSLDLIVRKLKVEYQKLGADDPERGFTPAADTEPPRQEPADDVKIFDSSERIEPKSRPIPPKKPAKKSGVTGRKFYGLANTLLDKMNVSKDKRRPLGILLRVLFSPVFILLTLALLFVYVGALFVIIAAAAILGILELALILVSVAELVYGIIMFFTSVPVALIELGLGTMLIGIVTAITALVYQLLTGVIPLAMKKITALYKTCFAFLKEFIFGSPEGGDRG